MSVPMDGDDYTWEETGGGALLDVPKNYRSVHGLSGRSYDTRTCAERHGEQLAELVEHVHGLTVMYTTEATQLRAVIDAQGATIYELKAALLRLSDQVLEMARTIEQWRGEL